MQSGCAICQDPFDTACGIIAIKCGHVFHNICLDQWLERSSTCPECRRNVCKNSLTKLFFNTSFDDLGKNASLDALKEQLHEKNLEILRKNEKIKELQTYYARSEKEVEKMHQKQMELENELSAKKRDLLGLNRAEARIQHLLQENSILQNELEHLNNVKTIVEGCCNDANIILAEAQVHVSSQDGKVATRKMATYCSVIKRELARSIEQKTQLQNELTNAKRQIGMLQAKWAKHVRLLEQQQQLKRSMDASPLPLGGNVCVKTISTPQCIPKSDLVGCENQMTPIPFDFPENKKKKMNVVVLDKEISKISTQVPKTPILRPPILRPPVLKLTRSAFPSRAENEDSVSRVGYNGLGGHGRVVTGSGVKRPFRKT